MCPKKICSNCALFSVSARNNFSNSAREICHGRLRSCRHQKRRKKCVGGFATISIETLGTTSKAASAHDVAVAYCQGTPLRNEIEARGASRLEEATQTATDALARRFGSGAIEGRMSAHVITAVR